MERDLPRHLQKGNYANRTEIASLTDKIYSTLLENPNAIQEKVKTRRQNNALKILLAKTVHHMELEGLQETEG